MAIHDVGPGSEAETDELLHLVTRYVRIQNVAMLVVPNHWGEHPIVPNSQFARKLQNWSDWGVSMFAHGWYHRDETVHRDTIARLKAQHMTAREGEFLGLDVLDARRRMAASRELIEGITLRPVAGFVAPAWLYGKDTLQALREEDFLLAEDHWKVWSPHSGQTVARGPVITWATRSKARIASSLAIAGILPSILQRTSTVRIAVHPGDVKVPAVLRSIERTLARVVRTHEPISYEDLVGKVGSI